MYIKVKVTPSAKKEKVVKETDTLYRIEVKEPAERNLANGRVREILAREYDVHTKSIKLVSGHRSVTKVFDVPLLDKA